MKTRSRTPNPKTALITGASSGIGLEIARQLAARDSSLVLVSRRSAELEKVANALRLQHGVSVEVIAADLGVPDAAAALFAAVRERGIKVDWLINNAGVGLYGDHIDLDPAETQKMLSLNILSLTELCHLFGAEMRARRSGRILNIASTAGYQPAPYLAAYGASKAYVLNFSEALAKELEDFGVTVSCLSPGPTDTAFFSDFDANGIVIGEWNNRDSAAAVAATGIELMLKGGLSKIVGLGNYLRALALRVATRRMVAGISKKVLAGNRGAAQGA